MPRHSFKEWVAATRYWSFPVSSMPVIATYTYLFSRQQMLPALIVSHALWDALVFIWLPI